MLDINQADTVGGNHGDSTEQHHSAPMSANPKNESEGNLDVTSEGVADEIAETLERKVLSDAEFLQEVEMGARAFDGMDDDADIDLEKEPDSEKPYFTFFALLLLSLHQIDNMITCNLVPQSLPSSDEDAIKERYNVAFELLLRRGLVKLEERFPDKNAFQVIEEINENSFAEALITILAMGLWKEKKNLQKLCEEELPDEYKMHVSEKGGEDEYGLFKGKDLNFELDFSSDEPPVDAVEMLKQLIVLIIQKRAERVLLGE